MRVGGVVGPGPHYLQTTLKNKGVERVPLQGLERLPGDL